MSEDSRNFVLDKEFTIRLEMLSDWHVGTGAGIPGSIDALLVKDNEDFPQVPAKTIVGIWRDAMETLTFGLDNGGQQNIWQKWVEVIFGSQPNVDKIPTVKPRPAILSFEPARINETLRGIIKNFIEEADQTKYKQALTFIKPEVKIDEASGTSETDMLRFAEMGRIGTVLETNCELDLDNLTDEQKQIISALLIASAKLIERIGGKRRRGSGKCELKVFGKEFSNEIKTLLETVDASKNPSVKVENNEHEFALPENCENWQKLEYTLTLKTPVSIVTATLGNVSESLDFIPGTYLLSHITKNKNLFKHLANGDLQVSPAMIQVNGKRGLPVPKVIYYDKLSGGFDKDKKVYNRFNETDRKKLETGDQKKNYREGYVSSLEKESGKLPIHDKVSKTLLMHNTVEDDFQRPTSDVGGVYSRQAISAGTTLRGEIRFKKSLNLDFSDASGEVRLGTSKKDDYGLADFEVLGEPDSTSPELKDKELIVYLESDILLRNGNLRQTNLTCDLKRELEKTFGENSLECTKDSLIQTRRIESWNVGWGFPRPTLIAMAAGSCVKFQAVTEIKPNDLRKLENEGIGERRGEGYGRIRFNPPILTEAINDWKKAEKPTSSGNFDENNNKTFETSDDKLKKFAEQIELTAWREELSRAVLQIADDENKRKTIFGFERKGTDSIPPLNQIGGLRSAIMRLKDQKDNSEESKKHAAQCKKFVNDWLEHLEETSNRIKKWDKNDNPEKAKEKTRKIKDLINNPDEVWNLIKDKYHPPTVVISEENGLKKKLWAEAVRALFDACMRAHKREGGES